MPQLFTNNARALLVSGITDSATSLTVEASKADLFPTANTGTGPVSAATNWFKITLQNAVGEVEIIYVRTRTAGSAIMSNLLRGQEGTTARSFSAGTVVGLRITAADVEGSIAAAANSVQLTGNQTIAGTKTFSNQIVASGGVQGDVTGNAGTVTNGVYTTGDQIIGGNKTFSGDVRVASRILMNNEISPNTTTLQWGDNTGWTFRMMTNVSGTPTLRYSFTDTGNFTATGNVTAFSDIRLKTDLTKISNALAKVNQLNGYTYKRIDTGERQTGVVAQEVQAVLPEAVLDNGETLAVAYGNMVGLLIEAVKELTARVDKLEGR
jgi:hypothetical protein